MVWRRRASGTTGIFVSRLIDENGFGGLTKQINDWSATQAQRLRVHSDFEALVAAIMLKGSDQEKDFRLGFESRTLQGG